LALPITVSFHAWYSGVEKMSSATLGGGNALRVSNIATLGFSIFMM
jgi:hypothetical protein